MADGEENVQAKSNNTRLHKNSKNKPTEVRNLLKKLSRWREESQREFSNIINSLSSTINEGFNDLTKEVGDIQEKLSASMKEEKANKRRKKKSGEN